MHLVTKILIVFAALFAVLLAALSMAFSYNAEQLRNQISAERAERDAANSALREAQATATTSLAKAKTDAEQAVARATAAETDKANALNERAKLMADNKSIQLERDRFMNESAGKDQRLQVATELAKSLQDQNTKLAGEFQRISKENADMLVALSDLQSQNQVMTQNVRALQEQLSDAANAASSKATAAVDPRAGAEMTAGPLVTARITKTTKSQSGDTLAVISAGANAGVKVGQRLNIVRGNKFVGALVILQADANESVGRIDTLGTGNSAMADDTVLSRVQ
ncbi:MAG: hypothetical protein QM783_13395 [Phycisphaerales bacterium]